MSVGGFKDNFCGHCNRPIGGHPTIIAGIPYHYECTQSPYSNNRWGHEPTFGPLSNQPFTGFTKEVTEAIQNLGKDLAKGKIKP